MVGTTARRSDYSSHFSHLKKRTSLSRILALDLHPGRFWYVVLEDSTELLDWGVRRNYRGTKPWRTVLIQKRLTSLLNQWEPSLVLMNEVARFSPQIRRIVTVVQFSCFAALSNTLQEENPRLMLIQSSAEGN